MIITPPTEMYCSLESKEIETIDKCITLLKDFRNKMDEYDYSYLHTPNDEEITNGDLTDIIFKLEDLKRINAMY